MRLRTLALGAGLVALLVLGTLPFLGRVPDAEMVPSLLPGDLVLILPGEPEPGDVVAVVDPLEPTRWTLRRVLTVGGTVRLEDGFYHTDAPDPVVLEMGRADGEVVLQEGHWLTRRLSRPIRWEFERRAVPSNRAWLAADNRDVALDSRWWGAVPLSAVQGVVRARLGAPGHAWRGWFTTSP